MSQELISLSPDLKRLRDEGYEIEIRSGFALVHNVPYVNVNREIKQGTLISDLVLTANVTVNPIGNHVMFFDGEHPCDMNGSIISGIRHQSQPQTHAEGIVSHHSFSSKPSGGYANYYDKFVQYITIISSHAQAIDDTVTAQTYQPIEADETSIFQYIDTNASRSNTVLISAKLKNQKIAIVGLGGTGSYILDHVAKTPVAEIHLFDGDEFLQHNAFRAPGAPSLEILKSRQNKTKYFHSIYSNMHKGIHVHPVFLDHSNIEQLLSVNFVFVAIDQGSAKRDIINALLTHGIPFIDVGIGVQIENNSLLGQVRLTTGTQLKNDHIYDRISMGDGGADAYSTNIQISDLNALNASLAVIQWKKVFGFYNYHTQDFNSIYSTYTGDLIHEDQLEK